MNKQRNQSTTGRITQGAAIAAVYVALTMIVVFRKHSASCRSLPRQRFRDSLSDAFYPICSAGQPDWISYSEAWQP